MAEPFAMCPLPAQQQPEWDPASDITQVVEELRTRPPLVTAAACYSLQHELSNVAAGRALVIEAGDCAERFVDATPEHMAAKLDLLGRLADLMESASGLPVVRIGRFAGQYAKPRSQPLESTEDGTLLIAYRGDAVNSPESNALARVCDARRLLAAYEHSARALTCLFKDGLRPPFGGSDTPFAVTYAGHEALLLDYEYALVRDDDYRGGVYGSSGHLLWIGERTRDVDGAHIDFAARINNPVAVKVGPHASGTDIARMIARLTTGHPPGRLSLIVRMGQQIRDELPRLLREIGDAAHDVLWLCDPMHANTLRNRLGQKTRVLSDIIGEVKQFFALMREHDVAPSGLHLETTPDPVLECVGSPADLNRHLDRYTSACDPRLNADQAMAVVAVAAETGWGQMVSTELTA